MKIEENDYPFEGHNLSKREYKILDSLISVGYLSLFDIKVDDHYYYIKHNYFYYNVFVDFNELKDYVLSNYYMLTSKDRIYLELLKTTKLDPSFDRNRPIRWASEKGKTEIVKLLLNDPRIDPSEDENRAIWWACQFGHIEIVELLLDDPRVREKLSDEKLYIFVTL